MGPAIDGLMGKQAVKDKHPIREIVNLACNQVGRIASEEGGCTLMPDEVFKTGFADNT